MQITSPNFSFLLPHDPVLVRLAASAEHNCVTFPSTALVNLRRLTEAMAKQAASYAGLYVADRDTFGYVIRQLQDRRIIGQNNASLFRNIRSVGNEAAHDFTGSFSSALHHLRIAHKLAIWFHRTFGNDPEFKPAPFLVPPDPIAASEEQRQALNEVRDEVARLKQDAAKAIALSEEERQRRLDAEEKAEKAYQEQEAAMELASEIEVKLEQAQLVFDQKLAKNEEKPKPSSKEITKFIEKGQEAEEELISDLDETETRQIIDQQLRDAGWLVDSNILRYSKGTRPRKDAYMAISEWPTATGPADYVLFIGLQPVAVVEAKKGAIDVRGAIQQAQRYSESYEVKGEEKVVDGPWESFKIPLAFASNGRAFLRQIREKSGIWFRDLRKPTNLPRALEGWYSPEGISKLLEQDIEEADQKLANSPVDLPGLRYYQIDAVEKIEERIADGQREILVAMATGTGKTRTCLSLIYRLIKANRFNRILFLVDRSALGEQAGDKFNEVRLENHQTFSQIYDLKELGEIKVDEDTRVHISTVQGMVKRLLYNDGEHELPVDQYDCVVVDECHRGYNLDKEMGELELGFRSEDDYISKYRRVLDHFDAVKVGLTATPALHTTQIFGKPVVNYSYRQAVIDGFLVDHEPPIQINTHLAKHGMSWQVGEELKVYNPTTGEVDLSQAPDEIELEIEHFNRQVVTRNFNRVVCQELAKHIDPHLPGKTVVFCATDSHADQVVDLLTQAFKQAYGEIRHDVVQKITAKADKPGQLIRNFKNESRPKVAVTVDLLSTGIDVPPIENIVFIRRVKSRILYEQMLGRATRLCPGCFDGEDKEVFRVFDAVQLYEILEDVSSMKPIVVKPNLTIAKLVEELGRIDDPDARRLLCEQLVVKLRRKKKALKANEENIKLMTGKTPEELIHTIQNKGADVAWQLFSDVQDLAVYLDNVTAGRARGIIISEHEDRVTNVERGYGKDRVKPEDYLDSFSNWIRLNQNQIPALLIVTQRPSELTRKQLKELKLELDKAGYTETNLRTAWRELKNEDIVASIIGYIRSQALGTPLVSYEERVDKALKQLEKSRSWTNPQRNWLRRIGKQIKADVVVDREAMDAGMFKDRGGYNRINKAFSGELLRILKDFHEAVWEEAA